MPEATTRNKFYTYKCPNSIHVPVGFSEQVLYSYYLMSSKPNMPPKCPTCGHTMALLKGLSDEHH